MARVRIHLMHLVIIVSMLYSFFAGVSVLPSVVSHILSWLHIVPSATSSWPWSFPYLGGVWFAYFAVAYYRTRTASLLRGNHFARLEHDYRRNCATCSSRPAYAACSPLEPEEQERRLVEGCYEQYRQALRRYEPSPLPELKTPPKFCCQNNHTFVWQLTGRELLPILRQDLLQSRYLRVLLPLLAHHLAWYNSDELALRGKWETYPDQIGGLGSIIALVLTGNGIWLPVLFRKFHFWRGWLSRRIEAADEFAWWLGQGSALEQVLRFFEEELKRRGQEDLGSPSLRSRIKHLQMLNTQEREQMRRLGLKPVEATSWKGDMPLSLQLNLELDLGAISRSRYPY
jgi:hypothetical protein